MSITTSISSTDSSTSPTMFHQAKPMAISTITVPANSARSYSPSLSTPAQSNDSSSHKSNMSPSLRPSESDSSPPSTTSTPSSPCSPDSIMMNQQKTRLQSPPPLSHSSLQRPVLQYHYHHHHQQPQSQQQSPQTQQHTYSSPFQQNTPLFPQTPHMSGYAQRNHYMPTYHHNNYSYYPHVPLLLGNNGNCNNGDNLSGSTSDPASSPLTLHERRQRNKTASAKYRAKKNQQHGEMRAMIATLSKENELLVRQLDQARDENKRLKSACDKLRGKMLAEKMLNKILQEDAEADKSNISHLPAQSINTRKEYSIDINFDLDVAGDDDDGVDDCGQDDDSHDESHRRVRRRTMVTNDSGGGRNSADPSNVDGTP